MRRTTAPLCLTAGWNLKFLFLLLYSSFHATVAESPETSSDIEDGESSWDEFPRIVTAEHGSWPQALTGVPFYRGESVWCDIQDCEVDWHYELDTLCLCIWGNAASCQLGRT